MFEKGGEEVRYNLHSPRYADQLADCQYSHLGLNLTILFKISPLIHSWGLVQPSSSIAPSYTDKVLHNLPVLSLLYTCTLCWQSANHRIKPVADYLPSFSVGEQAAEDLVCYGGKVRRQKNGGLTVLLVASRRPNFPPVRAAFLHVPVARRRTNFSHIRSEGASNFTSRRRRMNKSQLWKGRSENF
jgi:hypothetical protein